MATVALVAGFNQGTIDGGVLGNSGLKWADSIAGSTIVTGGRTGTYCLQNSGTAVARNTKWSTASFPSGQAHAIASVYFRLPTLPAGRLGIVQVEPVAGSHPIIWFNGTNNTINAEFEFQAGGQQGPVLAANTWYRLDVWVDFSTNPNRIKWSIDGVAQTDVTFAQAATTLSLFDLGTTGAETGTSQFDDFVFSVTSGDYPLGEHKVLLLGVDTGQNVIASDGGTAFRTFTANGTISGAWDGSVAPGLIDEVPPNVSATADGIVQITTSTTAYMEVPFTSYTLGSGETVAGLRAIVRGWAASGTAATIGLRAYNGTTEETLVAGTVDPAFDNAATTAHICKMLTAANYATQAQLNALALRLGFSSDAAPDIGAHALYVEVAIKAGAGAVALAGTGNAAAGATGALSETRPIAGKGNAAAGATGALGAARPITGKGTAAAGATGVLGASRAVAGNGGAAASATGALTVTGAGGGPGVLSGKGSAAASATGTLQALRSLAGSLSAASGARGILGALRALGGSAASAGSAKGTSSVSRAVAGSGSAAASARGSLTVAAPGITPLAGVGSAAAGASATLRASRSVAGTAKAAASASASLARGRPVAGTCAASASAVATLTVSGPPSVVVEKSSSRQTNIPGYEVWIPWSAR